MVIPLLANQDLMPMLFNSSAKIQTTIPTETRTKTEKGLKLDVTQHFDGICRPVK